DELVKRLLLRAEDSGRPDDKDEGVIENRIRVYREKTEPVMNYYKEHGKYKPVNGMGDIDEIFQGLCDVVDDCL
ncbi:MAG: adenylate kinase, partial [Bacteroidales bacterium]|nr:adenylate kinase [Bacteroidales bacterium]